MWKKTEDEHSAGPATQAPGGSGRRSAPAGGTSSLGPSILIKGDLTGEEDLVIHGRIEGEVRLRQNSVTVGQQGRIKADVHGKSIRVEGEVRGNLYGGEEVVIRASGRVQGNIVSPRVTLENGSKFKGAIDMEPAGAKPAAERPAKRGQKVGAEAPTAASAPSGGGRPGGASQSSQASSAGPAAPAAPAAQSPSSDRPSGAGDKPATATGSS